MAFSGFPPAALIFYEGLAADNSKAYWLAHKQVYDVDVRGSMAALVDELGSFGPFRIFRPYNDVRFAKGRPPYKEEVAAVTESDGGCSYYVRFGRDGLGIGVGMYHMATDQLERFRAALDAEPTGDEVAAICAAAERRGDRIGALDELKTAPRGYPKDHPRIELLRRKGLTAFRAWEVAPWLHTRAALTRVRDGWRAMAPLAEWLETHVGPSTLPPPDFGR